MVGNVTNYNPSILQFSSSKLFFQNQNQLLQKVWFFSPASIDVHFKYTFQQVQPYYFMQWWEFEWITLNHDVCESWIVYKLWFASPRFQHVKCLSVDLLNDVISSSGSIWSMLKTFPLIQWTLFLFVLCLLPFAVWKWLFWLNLVWVWVLFLFSIWKTLKVFYKLIFKTNRADYKWFAVDYDEPEDVLLLTPELIPLIKKLPELQITKIAYTWNCLYLLQDIHVQKNNLRMLVKWKKYSSVSYTEQEKADLQQRTMSYIQHPDFLSQFIQY